MHIHILGICGTFMGSLAILARAQGHKVTGSDQNVYPPMSDLLTEQGIELIQGYDPAQLTPRPDMVVIGNAMKRGNPCVEAVLNQGIPYTSGPQWLHDHVLPERWVLAVAGTHGKTTTAGMLAWILEDCGYQPGFLIGGVPGTLMFPPRWVTVRSLLSKPMNMTVHSLINARNLCITARVHCCLITSNLITRISLKTSPRLKNSSIIWCAWYRVTAKLSPRRRMLI